LGGIAVLLLFTAVLLYNKSRMEASATTDVQSVFPVSVLRVAMKPFERRVAITGVIAANNDVAIVSEAQGKIVGISAEVGQYKNAGDVLLQVDDELKKAAYATAEVNYEKAKKDFERFESLRRDSAVTDQQYESARLGAKAAEAQFVSARREYNDTKIATPIAGIVTARLVDIGAYIQRGTPVANVVDISRLKVKVSVPESDAFLLRAGDPVDVTTDVYPGATFRGSVKSVSAKGDDAHTYPVEIVLANGKEHPLKAGMFGRVSFVSLDNKPALLVPREAIVGSAKSPQIYVVQNDRARLRSVAIGQASGNTVAVLSGIAEGETVIVGGQNTLRDSAAVTVTQQQ
jgi:RND family efflux transporter MFP subunit